MPVKLLLQFAPLLSIPLLPPLSYLSLDKLYGLMHSATTCDTSRPPVSESVVPLPPKANLHQPVKQEPPVVPIKHQLDLAGIAGGNPPTEPNTKYLHGRKRKTTCSVDTPSQGVGNSAGQGLRSRPLAKRPMLVPNESSYLTSSSSSSGAADLLGILADPETCRAPQFNRLLPR